MRRMMESSCEYKQAPRSPRTAKVNPVVALCYEYLSAPD